MIFSFSCTRPQKLQKQKENNSPWISPQRVKNIPFAKKFITIPVSEKEDGQLSIYNVSVGTRMQFCMDLKLSKRNVQPLTIKRWIWAPIAIAQWGLNHFETKFEFPPLDSGINIVERLLIFEKNEGKKKEKWLQCLFWCKNELKFWC